MTFFTVWIKNENRKATHCGVYQSVDAIGAMEQALCLVGKDWPHPEELTIFGIAEGDVRHCQDTLDEMPSHAEEFLH